MLDVATGDMPIDVQELDVDFAFSSHQNVQANRHWRVMKGELVK